MIIVRPFQPDDKPAIQEMHTAMGFEYEQPDWATMPVSAVVEVDGKPNMAAFLRKTATAYLLHDPRMNNSKRIRLGHFLILNRELLIPAQRAGITEWEAFLPPTIEPTFGKLLGHLGWKKNLWPCYSREIL